MDWNVQLLFGRDSSELGRLGHPGRLVNQTSGGVPAGKGGGDHRGSYHREQMTLADRVKQDLTSAMKAGEKDRVGTLRYVLSELQKAAKEGGADELAVLRRERKRRQESATAFREGGRDDLAAAEEAESAVIEAYLPAELSDAELREIVRDAVVETGATGPKDMGRVMRAAMEKAEGRADGRRVSALAQEALKGAPA